MPELPEVETIRRQLEKALKGKTIRDVSVRMDKMIKVGSGKISTIKKGSQKESAKFIRALKGVKVLHVSRRAKFLIIELSDGKFLFVHLRMSGQMIFAGAKSRQKEWPGKHTHVEFTFIDGSKLFYNDYRQFGHMRLVDKKEAAQVFTAENLGPEPLEMTLSDFAGLVARHPKKRVKDFLLNQKVIAGIGNIYADESLFAAHIRPERKVGTLKKAEISNLFRAIQKVLKRAIELKGSSFRTYLNINGESGRFVSEHKVYGRAGKPCLKCGTRLSSKQVGGRTTVSCPHCQK